MTGMSNTAGRRLDEMAHIRQSIRDILTTRIGSRVMRRDYGSLVPDLIDHPGNAVNRLRLMAATVGAILRYEPRIVPTRIDFAMDATGLAQVFLDAVRRDGPRAGSAINLSVPLNG
ncbi:MAG: baseplate assembly protein [Rhodocyclaceae bacterium]|nr:baseplate assembly protein [Rhodocyclaceae bacterium]